MLSAGIGGGIVLLVWLLASNTILPYKTNMIHKIAPSQLAIHRALKENITEPGTYTCPYLGLEEERLLPDYRNQPVYSIIYEVYTHGGGSIGTIAYMIFLPDYGVHIAVMENSSNSKCVKRVIQELIRIVSKHVSIPDSE